MKNNDKNENPMMKNAAYRRLLDEKNKLIKRINFAEQRIEKYGYALSSQEICMLQQRIDSTVEQLADVNDKISDLEDGITVPLNEKWTGHASKTLQEASKAASR